MVLVTDDEPYLDGRMKSLLPNVNRLFNARFSDAHAATNLCCPSRASLYTGLRTSHHGVTKNDAAQFKPQMTVATQAQAIGYQTFFGGKYLNGWAECCGPMPPPGWTHFAANAGGYSDFTLHVDGVAEYHPPPDYSTDVVADKLVGWIENAPPGPILTWWGGGAPHEPTTPADRHKDASCAAGIWEPPSFNEADVSDKPSYIRRLKLRRTPVDQVPKCRTLLAVDEMLGRIEAALNARGRETIYIYASDNGMHEGEHRLRSKRAPHNNRVPLYVGGNFPVAHITDRVQGWDVPVTICHIIGCTLGPYPTGQAVPDGKSFLELLNGTALNMGRDAVLDEFPTGSPEIPEWFAVTTTSLSSLGLWHYIEYKTGEKELYDISNGPCWLWERGRAGDPCRLTNRAGDPSYAAVRAALAKRLTELKAQ